MTPNKVGSVSEAPARHPVKNSGFSSQNSIAGAQRERDDGQREPTGAGRGMPTTVAMAAPTTPPARSARPRSSPALWVTQPPTAPPMAAKAICPRLT